MHKRMFLATILTFGFVFLLIACGPGATVTPPDGPPPSYPTEEPTATEVPEAQPAARIDSITNDPASPTPGEVVTFTILYSNPSSDEPLSSPMLEVIYSENLVYCPSGDSCKSEPLPDVEEPDSHSLQYVLEDPLNPGAQNTVTVSFTVEEIPPALRLEAKISGSTSQGGSEHSATIAIPPPVVDQYPEGVEIVMPYQHSGAILHSEQRDFDFDPMSIEVGGEGYTIDRPIIYLDVYEGENLVNSFSPPILLYVDIPDELKSLAKAKKLVILLYDRNSELWIPCDGNNETDSTQCSATTIDADLERAWISVNKWTSGTGWGKR